MIKEIIDSSRNFSSLCFCFFLFFHLWVFASFACKHELLQYFNHNSLVDFNCRLAALPLERIEFVFLEDLSTTSVSSCTSCSEFLYSVHDGNDIFANRILVA